MVSRVRPVLGWEPHHYRPAAVDRCGPPAGPDQHVAGSGEGRGHAREGEGTARETAGLHQRQPGRGIALADSLPSHRVPDLGPACRRGVRAERTADDHVTVPDEGIHVHQPILACPASRIAGTAVNSRDLAKQEHRRICAGQ